MKGWNSVHRERKRERGMTLAEFLDWEERQELRFEFDGVQPEAMADVTINHAAIQVRLITAVGNRLRGCHGQIFGSNLKVMVNGSIRYPDAMILCTPGNGKATVIDDPVVVFEIVSPSTERVDRIVKSAEYRETPSIQAYVMLQQDFVGATVFRRAGEIWVAETYGAGAVVTLPGAAIDLPLDEAYEGLDLPG